VDHQELLNKIYAADLKVLACAFVTINPKLSLTILILESRDIDLSRIKSFTASQSG
jgi:hypothetical protein